MAQQTSVVSPPADRDLIPIITCFDQLASSFNHLAGRVGLAQRRRHRIDKRCDLHGHDPPRPRGLDVRVNVDLIADHDGAPARHCLDDRNSEIFVM
ncbi:MAG TPA: hypothetical protein PKB10_01595, partial [Tepidisphaeraceae bacterium]|nr:hypothetical protein [Tepidisphaeraceae bacterium]